MELTMSHRKALTKTIASGNSRTDEAGNALMAISADADVKAVQTMLGHESGALTLDTCADLFPRRLNRWVVRQGPEPLFLHRALLLQGSGWRDSNPRPLRPEPRHQRV